VLRALPISGFAAPVTYNNIGKPSIVLFLLGGVLGNSALIGFVAALDYVTGPSILPPFIRDAFGPVIFVQVYYVVVSLAPLGILMGLPVWNDGRLIVAALRGRLGTGMDLYHFYRQTMTRYGAEIDARPSAAWNRIVPHLFRSEVWTNEFARGDALAAAERELVRGSLTPEEEMWVLDYMISVGLVSGDLQFRSRLDRWSERARELGPDVATLKGSRGAVLVELGQFEAGRALLQELAAANNGRAIDVAMTTIFLALAEQGLGNSPAARRLLTDARRMVEADSVLAFLHPLTERTAGALGASQN
jgi:hypothetical protein